MIHRFLLCMFLFSLVVPLGVSAQPAESSARSNYDRTGQSWDWSYSSEEGGGGSSFLGVDIADVSAERLGELKLKEEHGAEVMMVDQDAPAGKAGVHEHDVIVSLNGTAIESAAQLRRMIKETPPGRVVTLGISRDGQPMSIKVQLADRHKSMAWEPKLPEMPEIPKMPAMPDFDIPISVVIVHQSARSGLMVENITAQLGDFFGVKDGKGVLVRSVEKGSRGEKAGFRAGDVIVKVNNQPVHDTSDFVHALRSSSGGAAAVTVMREKREQNLTLTLPEKKDSGSLLEDSFDFHEFTAETEQAINRAGEEIARLGPAIMEKGQQQAMCWKDTEKRLQDSQQKLQEQQQELQERLQERQQKLRHELSGEWAEI
ncbi:MAG TPA: PDZ domain-containing protein [Terriglobales bacterium]|jgi:serine protease Do|nr:PDZ domain-containing protein [Terriglobales bacterium]